MARRGQAALEYLMTYGWALLIIAIVAIALWKLGVFSPTRGGEKVLKDFDYFTTLAWSYTNTGTFSLTIKNTRVGYDVNITGATVTVEGIGTATNLASNVIIEIDGQNTITVTGFPRNCTAGRIYTVDVTIQYLKWIGGSWQGPFYDRARYQIMCRSAA